MTAISVDSSIGIYHNNSAFHGHKPPNNVWSFLPHQMSLSKGQNRQLNGQFAAPSLLAISAHSCPLSFPLWPIKGGLDSPFHHTLALKQYSSHSHPQQSKEPPSNLPANFI
jgi:hypothetical protein